MAHAASSKNRFKNCISLDQLYQFWSSGLLHVQFEDIIEILLPILFGSIVFPIILSQVVGSDSQCLSPLRPSSQNLTVHYETVPLQSNKKCKYFSKIFVAYSVQDGQTFLKM